MGNTSYRKKWEETYTWLSPVNTKLFSFRIGNSGLSQAMSYMRTVIN